MRILPLLVILLVFGCGNSDYTTYGEFESLMEVPSTEQAPPSPSGNMQMEREKQIIKTGGVDFQSGDIVEDYKAIRLLLSGYDAYIESENQSNTPHEIRYNLSIRVAADQFDTLFHDIAGLAKRPDNQYTNREDVSEQYYDLETRLRNQRALEQRYRDLLGEATEVKEILEIEKSLNEVRTNIERLEGQYKYLGSRIGYSTIHASFYEVLPYTYDTSPRKGFGARLLNALENGWQGFLTFLVVVVRLWPFMILLGILVYLLNKVRRKKGNNG